MIELHYLASQPIAAAEYRREELLYGDVIAGPAIIREAASTTFMLPQQVMAVGEYGELRIRRAAGERTAP
jgi:N-methylhydantoinase A